MQNAVTPNQDDALERAVAKLQRRVVPILFGLGFLSILDRGNVAYAALEMNQDLGFTDKIYAIGAGVFFIGYFLFEIPSNLILIRVGARKWLARICLTWGIIAGCMMFVSNPFTFGLIRFLLGVAEAGLFPAVYLLLATWFPAKQRALAMALFVAAEPVAMIVAGPLSGWLVGFDNILGLRGWQFLFIAEAIPTILFTIIVLKFLPNSPGEASWLTDSEKTALAAKLASEQPYDPRAKAASLGSAMKSRKVWLLVAVYFCVACASYGLNLFTPLIIEGFTKASSMTVGLLSMIPYIAALIAMPLVARSSDRTGERRLHFCGAMLTACVGLLICGFAVQHPVVAMIGLTMLGAGIYATLPTFWPQPATLLVGTAAAGGFALINSIGNLGGFVGPYVIGALKSPSGSYMGGLALLAALMVVGAALCFFGMRRRRDGSQVAAA